MTHPSTSLDLFIPPSPSLHLPIHLCTSTHPLLQSPIHPPLSIYSSLHPPPSTHLSHLSHPTNSSIFTATAIPHPSLSSPTHLFIYRSPPIHISIQPHSNYLSIHESLQFSSPLTHPTKGCKIGFLNAKFQKFSFCSIWLAEEN